MMPKFTDECRKVKFPEIDFEKYTLIAKTITLGNCGAGMFYRVKVLKDEKRKFIAMLFC